MKCSETFGRYNSKASFELVRSELDGVDIPGLEPLIVIRRWLQWTVAERGLQSRRL